MNPILVRRSRLGMASRPSKIARLTAATMPVTHEGGAKHADGSVSPFTKNWHALDVIAPQPQPQPQP